jgi:hypothetical protein
MHKMGAWLCLAAFLLLCIVSNVHVHGNVDGCASCAADHSPLFSALDDHCGDRHCVACQVMARGTSVTYTPVFALEKTISQCDAIFSFDQGVVSTFLCSPNSRAPPA